MNKTNLLKIFAWSVSGIVLVLAVIAWGQRLSWHLSKMTSYDLFPLFGLTAFSLMWAHYIVSAIRQYLGVDKKVLHTYIEATSLVVLLAIFAHPGLLEWQLWRDGSGLPPNSVLHYVGPGLKVFAVFGMVSLLVFLAYELRRWYGDQSWWQYVGYATDTAMLLIIVHSFKLGHTLQSGWLRIVWIFYAASLVLAMAYTYSKRFSSQK